MTLQVYFNFYYFYGCDKNHFQSVGKVLQKFTAAVWQKKLFGTSLRLSIDTLSDDFPVISGSFQIEQLPSSNHGISNIISKMKFFFSFVNIFLHKLQNSKLRMNANKTSVCFESVSERINNENIGAFDEILPFCEESGLDVATCKSKQTQCFLKRVKVKKKSLVGKIVLFLNHSC